MISLQEKKSIKNFTFLAPAAGTYAKKASTGAAAKTA